MVSAGLDTVPGNLIMGIAYLATPHGQEIQAKALEEIYKVYPNGEAWERCLVEEKVPYITALVKEILRFWTVRSNLVFGLTCWLISVSCMVQVIPICLPRVNIKDIPYKGATIPAGTTFFMVRQPCLRVAALPFTALPYSTLSSHLLRNTWLTGFLERIRRRL